MHGLAITAARLCRLRLFHAGMISWKTAGSGSRRGAYQPTPKPSPFSGSDRSSEWKLWWMRECRGSVSSVESRTGGPM
jgi:hypothetical protein